MPILSVHLVAWNGAKYVPYLFESLRNQIFRDWQFLIWDNGSDDQTAELLKNGLNNFDARHEIKENGKNIGFAGGHNRLLEILNAGDRTAGVRYILLLNQDMYLLPDCLKKLIDFMERQKLVGAVTPRLMRWNFSAAASDGLQKSFTKQVDSLGLKVERNRRVTELTDYRGETEPLEVFGVSGALPLYRLSAINQTGLFDEDFFSYKEDADLAFRFKKSDISSFCVPTAVAYHDRSAAGPLNDSWRAIVANRRKKSALANFYSYRNHLLMLIKNESGSSFWRDAIFIFWYEFQKFVYLLLSEPKTLLKAWIDIFRLWPKMRKKRKRVFYV